MVGGGTWLRPSQSQASAMSLVLRRRGSSLMSSTRGGMASGVPVGLPDPSVRKPAAQHGVGSQHACSLARYAGLARLTQRSQRHQPRGLQQASLGLQHPQVRESLGTTLLCSACLLADHCCTTLCSWTAGR